MACSQDQRRSLLARTLAFYGLASDVILDEVDIVTIKIWTAWSNVHSLEVRQPARHDSHGTIITIGHSGSRDTTDIRLAT
jgi:hypothetical protein